jgi:hypothetical protein
LDIFLSRDEIDRSARSRAKEQYVGWGLPAAPETAAGRRSERIYSAAIV